VELLASEEVVFAEGVNHRVVLEGTIVRMRVWKAPQIPSDDAAADFALLVERVIPLAAQTSALVLDVIDAPPVAGPKTQAALESLFAAFASRNKRVAIVTAGHALQQLQMRRLVSERAPRHGAVFTDAAEAARFAG
jgi:hypothetical protein